MLKRMAETEKGIVYFSSFPVNDGRIFYKGYLSLKTNIGGFSVQEKVFQKFTDCAVHVEQLKFDLLNYENDPKSYLRLFV